MSERPVAPVREDLLHDRVVAVLALGLGSLERRVGEDGMVAPGGEQLALPLRGLLVLVADAPDDEAGGDLLVLLRGERGVLRLGDLGIGDPGLQLVIPDRASSGSASRRLRGWRRSRRGCWRSPGR